MADNYVSRKVFYLLRFLQQNTDENHGVTTNEIIAYLKEFELKLERKTLYTDIDLLRDLGYDIQLIRVQRRNEYRLVNRPLDISELKILADAVASSKFITRRKSRELIAKLNSFTSENNARELSRTVAVENRIKSMNESVYQLIDHVHSAINNNEQLTFQYFGYAPDHRRILHHDGETYLVSPLSLALSDGNYYLYAWDHKSNSIRTYRVDRMLSVQKNGQERNVPEEYENFDPIQQTNKSFSMHSGQLTDVTLSFDNSLATVVIDRFGQNVMLIPGDNNTFTVRVNVLVSPTFLGWIFGFGTDAKILSPKELIDSFQERLEDIASQYVGK